MHQQPYGPTMVGGGARSAGAPVAAGGPGWDVRRPMPPLAQQQQQQQPFGPFQPPTVPPSHPNRRGPAEFLPPPPPLAGGGHTLLYRGDLEQSQHLYQRIMDTVPGEFSATLDTSSAASTPGAPNPHASLIEHMRICEAPAIITPDGLVLQGPTATGAYAEYLVRHDRIDLQCALLIDAVNRLARLEHCMTRLDAKVAAARTMHTGASAGGRLPAGRGMMGGGMTGGMMTAMMSGMAADMALDSSIAAALSADASASAASSSSYDPGLDVGIDAPPEDETDFGDQDPTMLGYGAADMDAGGGGVGGGGMGGSSDGGPMDPGMGAPDGTPYGGRHNTILAPELDIQARISQGHRPKLDPKSLEYDYMRQRRASMRAGMVGVGLGPNVEGRPMPAVGAGGSGAGGGGAVDNPPLGAAGNGGPGGVRSSSSNSVPSLLPSASNSNANLFA